jgi:transketolase
VPFRPGKPTFVIAHTHNGHPITFMSNNAAWHHKVPSAEQLQHALEELESAKRTSSNGGQSR